MQETLQIEVLSHLNRLQRTQIWIMVAGLEHIYKHTFIKSREEFRLALERKLPYYKSPTFPHFITENNSTPLGTDAYDFKVCRRLHNPLLKTNSINDSITNKTLGRNFYWPPDIISTTLISSQPVVIIERSKKKDGYYADLVFLHYTNDTLYTNSEWAIDKPHRRESLPLLQQKFEAENQHDIESIIKKRLEVLVLSLCQKIEDQKFEVDKKRRLGDQMWEILKTLI